MPRVLKYGFGTTRRDVSPPASVPVFAAGPRLTGSGTTDYGSGSSTDYGSSSLEQYISEQGLNQGALVRVETFTRR
jgi:hypothetical protein|uniref:Uncharacterized protein n=1 Tax=Picea glauca TaxID=3330 RepID=A0A101LUF4_PICGL|nr:hypothetical protein ABT39_MTgene2394 [Picea glauca]QHR88977.1 hypothetical protein Q903MT_gene2996 [Picea sitchensis]